MAKRIVFLPYHGFGHINPCLPVAAILRQAGHTVSFAGVAYFRQHLLQQEYPYHTLDTVPFGMSFEHWHNTQLKKSNLYRAELHDRRHDTLYHRREADLLKMLDAVQPDIILLDALQATDFIVLYQHLRARNIAIGMVYALLPPDTLPGRPPHNSSALPGQHLRILRDTLKVQWRQLRREWRKKIKFLGYNDHAMIRRRLRQNSIPKHYYTNRPSLHTFRTAMLDEFIFAPLEFDFPGITPRPEQHYLGFMAPVARMALSNPGFEAAWPQIVHKHNAGHKLIYCSFGTTDASQHAPVKPFLEKLIRISQRHGYVLIVAWQDKAAHNALPSGGNIYFFPSVPQLDVLASTDIFITHCGLNSVKESIEAGVPMLLYPIHPDYDPRGNAARAEYHGLGLRGNVAKDSEQTLEQKIYALLTNQQYKNSVQGLRQKNAAYTAEKLLTRISEMLPPK